MAFVADEQQRGAGRAVRRGDVERAFRRDQPVIEIRADHAAGVGVDVVEVERRIRIGDVVEQHAVLAFEHQGQQRLAIHAEDRETFRLHALVVRAAVGQRGVAAADVVSPGIQGVEQRVERAGVVRPDEGVVALHFPDRKRTGAERGQVVDQAVARDAAVRAVVAVEPRDIEPTESAVGADPGGRDRIHGRIQEAVVTRGAIHISVSSDRTEATDVAIIDPRITFIRRHEVGLSPHHVAGDGVRHRHAFDRARCHLQ